MHYWRQRHPDLPGLVHGRDAVTAADDGRLAGLCAAVHYPHRPGSSDLDLTGRTPKVGHSRRILYRWYYRCCLSQSSNAVAGSLNAFVAKQVSRADRGPVSVGVAPPALFSTAQPGTGRNLSGLET